MELKKAVIIIIDSTIGQNDETRIIIVWLHKTFENMLHLQLQLFL